MPTTYPIHPGERLQRRIASVLTADLLPLDAFEGFTVHDDRDSDEMQYPFFSIQQTESQNNPPGSHLWHVRLVLAMVEDRIEANSTLGADARPRHELRAENVSARLFGRWEGLSLAESINAISNGQGVYVLKIYDGSTATASATEGEVEVQYSFTAICVSTEQ